MIMTISTNRPGHRATDVSDLGSTLKNNVPALLRFKHPHLLLLGIQIVAIKNSFKRQAVKWKTILSFFLA